MGVRVKAGMWCDLCKKPVAGQKSGRRVRGTVSGLLAIPTGGLSLLAVKSDDWHCPDCGQKVRGKRSRDVAAPAAPAPATPAAPAAPPAYAGPKAPVVLYGAMALPVDDVARDLASPYFSISLADRTDLANRLLAKTPVTLGELPASRVPDALAHFQSRGFRTQAPVEAPTAAAVDAEEPPASDPFDALQRLAELRDKGLVSAEEFEAKRKALVDRI